MTKRTAMLMAAGVVLALLGGSVALSFGLSGNQTAEAGPGKASKPIVRTIHRTIRVEKQAKGSNRPVQVVTLQAPLSDQPSSSDGPWDDDDAYEHDDDRYEHDDDRWSGSDGDHSSDDGWEEEGHDDD